MMGTDAWLFVEPRTPGMQTVPWSNLHRKAGGHVVEAMSQVGGLPGDRSVELTVGATPENLAVAMRDGGEEREGPEGREGAHPEGVRHRGRTRNRLPATADMVDLAPVLCAGVTVYRGLKRTRARPGHRW